MVGLLDGPAMSGYPNVVASATPSLRTWRAVPGSLRNKALPLFASKRFPNEFAQK
jgi:hypothetical protein